MITIPTSELWTLDDFAAFCIDHQHDSFLNALKHFMDCEHIYIQSDTTQVSTAFDTKGQPVTLKQLV